MISNGELIQLVSPQGKKYIRKLDIQSELHTHDGKIAFKDIIDLEFGDSINTHLGVPYVVLKPTLYEIIKSIDRRTQIIYPKDIGYILLRLGIGPGTQVVEAGCGSGGLTTALAYMVGDNGRVYAFDRREDFVNLCKNNLKKVGLDVRVSFFLKDIESGFDVKDMDTGFLDVREPWNYIDQFASAVKNGSEVGFLVPTANQVIKLIKALEKGPYVDIDVVEILLRRYKAVAERFRPDDRMVAHTGFLIFARVKM